ncbi:hypothetical protein ACFL59_04030 [Planctomycetota bacterium]
MLTLGAIAAGGETRSGVANALLRAMASDRMGHAYLLYGPLGAGKSELARSIAATRLCPSPAGARGGCGACSMCRSVSAGTHPDLHLLSPRMGKRDIAVDQVRTVLAELALAPLSGPGRVAIVSPADAMREEGANAFLKTLEEPPSRVLLMLVTSRPDVLLPTIRSRCMELRLPARSARPRERGEQQDEPAASCHAAANLVLDRQEGPPLDRATRAFALVEGAAAAETGSGTKLEKVRRALLMVFDLVLTCLRERFRQRARRGHPLHRNERSLLRVLEAAEQVERNATPRLVLEVLTLDLDVLISRQTLTIGPRL